MTARRGRRGGPQVGGSVERRPRRSGWPRG